MSCKIHLSCIVMYIQLTIGLRDVSYQPHHSLYIFKSVFTTLNFCLHDTKLAVCSVILSETHQTQLGLDLQRLLLAYT